MALSARDVVHQHGMVLLSTSGRSGETIRLVGCVPGGWIGHFALWRNSCSCVSIVCQLLIWVFTTFVVLCGRPECVPIVFLLAFVMSRT